MERDGVVRRVGKRPGTTRPSQVFELTPEVEQLLSKAYLPLLTHLVGVFAEALSPPQVETLLRQTGKRLASELSQARRIAGSVRARAAAASEILNEHLGAMTHVEGNGGIVIRGGGCPLAALTGNPTPTEAVAVAADGPDPAAAASHPGSPAATATGS